MPSSDLQPSQHHTSSLHSVTAPAERTAEQIDEQVCENCGNGYDKGFEILYLGARHTFDSFECAINVLAPKCGHCGTKIIGHGVEFNEHIFCCAHCAQASGHEGLRDRI